MTGNTPNIPNLPLYSNVQQATVDPAAEQKRLHDAQEAEARRRAQMIADQAVRNASTNQPR